MSLDIAIVSDIHHGPDRGSKKGSSAIPLLESFIAFTKETNPDCIIDLGDRISDTDYETDLRLLGEIASTLRKLPGTPHYLLGNHDVAKLSVADNEAALQCSLASASEDRNGFHLVFWNPFSKLDLAKGFSLQEGDLAWLKADLAATSLPSVIFTHVPLDNGSMKGNFYFEKNFPHHAAYPEAQGEAIRDIIERSGKVVLCINGHAHWNAHHCIDGIHYVTIPSLTELFTTWPEPNAAYARMSLSDHIEIEVFGRDPVFYRLPIKAPGTHWLNTSKDYAPGNLFPA
ncbi:MAG: hypothetical protein A2018_05085 [Alphaproteobacteria bacterium GWF2_58_20]|nr:MAG: hypothetical protein A2018_05085 [Alphaproteobacteria bacterium GWF2_58_20]